VLDLHTPAAPEVKLIAIITKPQWVPKTRWGLNAKLVFEGTTYPPHLWTCAVKCTVLEHHSNDGNHCQPAIVDFCIQRPLALDRVAFRAGSEKQKPRNAQPSAPWSITRHAVWFLPQRKELQTGNENSYLSPTFHWNLVQSFDTVWNVGELEVLRWRTITWESKILRDYVTNASNHGHTAIFDLCNPPPSKLSFVT